MTEVRGSEVSLCRRWAHDRPAMCSPEERLRDTYKLTLHTVNKKVERGAIGRGGRPVHRRNDAHILSQVITRIQTCLLTNSRKRAIVCANV